MLVYFLSILILLTACHSEDKPHVRTPLGNISGYIKTSRDGRNFSAFEGIPYAKPPFGDRRFEEPEPVEPWTGVWNARFPTECVQPGIIVPSKFTGDEDCLHINVYVPRQQPNSSEQLDVIVHIHGGGYMFCSGHFYSKPEMLMDRDVIFVTFNYRLGLFGFLSTEDDVVPGNNGLKDQVLALKWIQDNIASFGGNPNSVTLTGASAGASSTHLHYFSELSRGLFHRGSSQSGVALNAWSLAEEPLNKAKTLGEAVGCPTNPTRTLVQCLKQRPYQQLLDKMPLFYGYRSLPIAPFAPVVEKKSSKPFLSEDPYLLLIQGKVHNVPWLASHTSHEGTFPAAGFAQDLDNINKNWEELAPSLLDFNYTVPRSEWKTVAKKVKDHYLGQNQDINHENYLKVIQMFSDRFFLVDAETAIKTQAEVSKSPVYYYYFSYIGDDNPMKLVPHGGDSRYYFGDTFTGKDLTPNEIKMKDVLVDMLVAYAKTGKPTIKGVNWDPTGPTQLTYLDIQSYQADNIKMKTVEEFTPRSFWTSLGIKENGNLPQVNKL